MSGEQIRLQVPPKLFRVCVHCVPCKVNDDEASNIAAAAAAAAAANVDFEIGRAHV